MDILQILQTLGICIGALALVAIAVMMFFILTLLVPTPLEIEEDDSNVIEVIQTRLEDLPQTRRSRRKKMPPKQS